MNLDTKPNNSPGHLPVHPHSLEVEDLLSREVRLDPLLESFAYRLTERGTILCQRPEEITLYEWVVMVNQRCRDIGIAPAVDPDLMRLLRKHSNATQIFDQKSEIQGLLPHATGREANEQRKLAPGGRFASLEMTVAASAAVYLDSHGKVDIFQGLGVRVEGESYVLRRTEFGLSVSQMPSAAQASLGAAVDLAKQTVPESSEATPQLPGATDS